MLSREILQEIEKGEIKSRRQLYRRIGGRNRKLIPWLDSRGILIPNRWTKERFNKELKKLYPLKANDNWEMCRLAKRFYGTWNNALTNVIGTVNQKRYSELSDEDMKATIINHIRRYRRLPLREEFNGSSYDYPDWESIVNRFGLSKWSDVFSIIDLSGVNYYHDKKHGTGTVHIHEGVVYLSRQEFLIGKYLHKNGISFEKEVPYGNCNFVFDFYLTDYDVYIEYYGMETDDYLERVNAKRDKYLDRIVIEIFKHDNTIAKLDLEVQRL